jgi:poly(A) polymerase
MTNREAAIRIIKQLQSHGFEALLAGGCVRDMLMRKRPKDYDIATSARPNDVIKIFKRTIKVGAKFGVVIVLLENHQLEVATFRSDIGYTDGRHPGSVRFTCAAEDAGRRDFTINGMFYDPLTHKVIDYVKGQADLKRRVVRTIGNPDDRFSEDYLRMLRAVRFSTRLGFKIEPVTLKAVYKNAPKISKISAERIAVELESILAGSGRAQGASLLFKTGLAEAIFSSIGSQQIKSATIVLSYLPKNIDFALAISAFFTGCPTSLALEKCNKLKLSRDRIRHINFLLSNRGRLLESDMSLASLKKLLAEPYFQDLYELQCAIQKAKSDRRSSLNELIKIRRRINKLKDFEIKPKPLLNGHELMRLGIVPGPSLGQLIEELYIAQLEGHIQTKETAFEWAKSWLEQHSTRD